MTLLAQSRGALERQHPLLENPDFVVTLETSKALGAESESLCILNDIPAASPRGESPGESFPNTITILSMALRKVGASQESR